MKKPKIVLEAEASLAAKKAEVEAAQGVLNRLGNEVSAAHDALHEARIAADAPLPKCRIVYVRGGKVADSISAVIVRKTPGGMLVVREVGAPLDRTSKYKWSKFALKYRHTEKVTYHFGTTRELRDVPAEYMPTSSPSI